MTLEARSSLCYVMDSGSDGGPLGSELPGPRREASGHLFTGLAEQRAVTVWGRAEALGSRLYPMLPALRLL